MRMHNKNRRKIDHISYFRNKTINYGKKVDDFYIEDGIAYISCNITGYDDIIDHYSVKGYEWLNSDFTRFIEEHSKNIPTEYPILLEICGGDLTEDQQEIIERTIKKYYQMKLGNLQEEYDYIKTRAIRVLCAAAIFFFVDMLAHYICDLLGSSAFLVTVSDTVQVLFWFLLWSDSDIVFFQLADARWQRAFMAQVSSVQIIFKKRFKDVPVEPEIREEIFENVFHSEEGSFEAIIEE